MRHPLLNPLPSAAQTLSAIAMLGLALGSAFGQTDEREWFDPNDKALATLDFAGLALPSNVAELKRTFPQAELEADKFQAATGLECYVVRNFKHVDSARFFYFDDKLYQFEINYLSPRIEQLGGMQSVIQRLIDTWGPPDHVGEARRSWVRPMYNRRADFYLGEDRGQLIVTDLGLIPGVEARIKRADRRQSIDLGL